MKRILLVAIIFTFLAGCKKEDHPKVEDLTLFFKYKAEGKELSINQGLDSWLDYTEDKDHSAILTIVGANTKPLIVCLLSLPEIKIGSYNFDGTNQYEFAVRYEEINQNTTYVAGAATKHLGFSPKVIFNITKYDSGFLGGNFKGTIVKNWELPNPKEVLIEGSFLVRLK